MCETIIPAELKYSGATIDKMVASKEIDILLHVPGATSEV